MGNSFSPLHDLFEKWAKIAEPTRQPTRHDFKWVNAICSRPLPHDFPAKWVDAERAHNRFQDFIGKWAGWLRARELNPVLQFMRLANCRFSCPLWELYHTKSCLSPDEPM